MPKEIISTLVGNGIVTQSNPSYGYSLRFRTVNNETVYFPISKNCNPYVGQSVNPKQIKVITLERLGSKIFKLSF